MRLEQRRLVRFEEILEIVPSQIHLLPLRGEHKITQVRGHVRVVLSRKIDMWPLSTTKVRWSLSDICLSKFKGFGVVREKVRDGISKFIGFSWFRSKFNVPGARREIQEYVSGALKECVSLKYIVSNMYH